MREPVGGDLPSRDSEGQSLYRWGFLLLALGAVPLLSHAFVPLEEFIHRGDDAFYYFKLAANFPETGFWTYDGIHPTNGVQPLWAWILTGTAQLLHWLGIDDPGVLARIFVGLAALCQLASSLLLYRILSRAVSPGTGIAVAGAFLFSMAMVWGRVWGMENALYALLLVGTAGFYHSRFRGRATVRGAAVLGLLLGLTALNRLNAGLLVPCLLAFYLADPGSGGSLRQRVRLAVVAGAVCSAVLIPYLAWNLAATGHLLPVSGAVKAVRMEEFLREWDVASALTLDFWKAIYWFARRTVLWFLASRILDGAWAAGGRAVVEGWYRPFPGNGYFVAVCVLVPSVLLLGPMAAGRPAEWFRFLWDRLRRLAPFGWMLVFGVVDAVVSVSVYAYELRYAMVRWWFVENELVVVTLIGTLTAAAGSYLSRRWLPNRRLRLRVAVGWLAILVAYHTQASFRFYFDDEIQYPAWHLSWNDEMLRAAWWSNENLPEDAIIGSWNAGVIGYYSERPVVNLDGLINGFEFVPFLREDRLAEYVRREGITHLSDIAFEYEEGGPGELLLEELALEPVYRHHSEFMKQDYRIYRVGTPGSLEQDSVRIVRDHVKISGGSGSFDEQLDDHDVFGRSLTNIGDLDGDGIVDLAVGAFQDDDGGRDRGSVRILFMGHDGTVRAHTKISATHGGFAGELDDGDLFGTSGAHLGDIDGDGTPELAVGAVFDDDGGPDRGAVWILSLRPDGTVGGHRKISSTRGSFRGSLDDGDAFGYALAALDDLDGDGVRELAVGVRRDDDGGPDRGAVWILFLDRDAAVKRQVKISDLHGGFTGDLDDDDLFGISVSQPGDLDGDGVPELAVGAFRDDDGGPDRGAVWILFLERDGTVRRHAKISDTAGRFEGRLTDDGAFGSGVAAVGDMDGDGTPDLLVGNRRDGDGGPKRGAAWLLFLNRDGTVKRHVKISDLHGGFTGLLGDDDQFGYSVESLGDLDGDGGPDLALSAIFDDDGGENRGAVWILHLDPAAFGGSGAP